MQNLSLKFVIFFFDLFALAFDFIQCEWAPSSIHLDKRHVYSVSHRHSQLQSECVDLMRADTIKRIWYLLNHSYEEMEHHY